MNRCRTIALEKWPRRAMYEFYRTFVSDAFDVTATVNAEKLYARAHACGDSFFLLSLYAFLRAMNAFPELRQREVAGEALEFEKVAVMTPIMTRREMFRQIWCEYEPDFPRFRAAAAPKVAAAREGEPAPMKDHGDDFFCASCAPFLRFDAISPAVYRLDQTIPVLTWGKLENGGIPVGVRFHHRFVDGLHVGRFFDFVEQAFAEPESLYDEVR